MTYYQEYEHTYVIFTVLLYFMYIHLYYINNFTIEKLHISQNKY